MKKSLLALTLAVLVAVAAGVPVLAADEAPASVAVTVTGTNYNLLGTLAKDQVAEADSAYAGLNALKVTEAKDADGKAIEGMAGKTLHYLASKAAKDLMVGEANQGKTVTVKGKVFTDACALLVESFEVSGGEDDEWGDLPVGTMSQQQIL
jgi:hypothetical protein